MVNLVPFLTYVIVTTFTPGPNNILSMTNAMAHGYKNTLRFLGGIFCGFFVVMLICGLLNVLLLSFIPQVRFWMNLLGAAYMIYLALHIILSKPDADGDGSPSMASYRAGFTLQFLNLKVILYGITVYSLFIVQAYSSPWAMGVFALILAGIGFVAISCWALGGGLMRSFLSKYSRWFNLLMGALLIYTSVASLLQTH